MKKKHILIMLIILFVNSSCNEWHDRFDVRQKRAIGEYIVDLKKGKEIIKIYNSNKKFEDMYSIPDAPKEIRYYSDLKLIIHKNHTFEFTKPFYGETNTIKGTWKFVSEFDTPAYCIEMEESQIFYHDLADFYGGIELIPIKDNKKLPMRKKNPSTYKR